MKAFFVGILISLLSFASFANWDLEQRKIDFLLTSIERLENATFIRSGREYSGKKAARHLRMKLNSALNSFDPNQVTAEIFIEKLGSKSYFTGEPYQIRFADGRTIPARDWLYHQLSLFH